MTWTPHNIEVLTAMWANGDSASKIAGELKCGITRNAVIGKVNRLGLAGRKRRHNMVLAPRERRIAPLKALPKPRPVNPDIHLPPDKSTFAVTLQQLETHHCRWPIDPPSGPMMYCGAEHVDGLPYCPRHCRIAYRPENVRAA